MIKSEAEVRSYQEAIAYLGDRSERKLALNTWVVGRPDGYSIRYGPTTDLIHIYEDDTFHLGSPTFWEPSHIRRLNQFGPRGWRFTLHEGIQVVYAFFGDLGPLVVGGMRYPFVVTKDFLEKLS